MVASPVMPGRSPQTNGGAIARDILAAAICIFAAYGLGQAAIFPVGRTPRHTGARRAGAARRPDDGEPAGDQPRGGPPTDDVRTSTGGVRSAPPGPGTPPPSPCSRGGAGARPP